MYSNIIADMEGEKKANYTKWMSGTIGTMPTTPDNAITKHIKQKCLERNINGFDG